MSKSSKSRPLILIGQLSRNRTILLLVGMICIGTSLVFWHVYRLQANLVETFSLQDAARYSQALREFRTLYTSEVVATVKRHGIEVTHDYKTKDKEIVREREMIKSLKSGERGRWANQIPVASGVMGPDKDKTMAIDLAHRCQGHRHKRGYTLIELKIESNTPLYAAFEILLYGRLLTFSRSGKLRYGIVGRPILVADYIHLRVLAPLEYYHSYKLDWLERDLSRSIGRFARKKADVGMDFSFWQCKPGLPYRDWLKYWKNGAPVYCSKSKVPGTLAHRMLE